MAEEKGVNEMPPNPNFNEISTTTNRNRSTKKEPPKQVYSNHHADHRKSVRATIKKAVATVKKAK